MEILKNFGFWSCVFESVFYLAWRKINKYNLWIVWKWTNICVFISQNTLVPNLTKWPIQAQREHATSIQKSLKVNVWTQSEGNQLGVRGKENRRQEDESKGRWDKTQTKGESTIFNHVEWCCMHTGLPPQRKAIRKMIHILRKIWDTTVGLGTHLFWCKVAKSRDATKESKSLQYPSLQILI